MANNPYVNKVVYGADTLIDLTTDTVDASKVLSGNYFHLPSGQRVIGTCTYDADTSNGNVSASEILSGKIAYSNGQQITGTMPNIGQQTSTISTKGQSISISQGYHDGSGKVYIDYDEQDKIKPGNIKKGVTILGTTGTYEGSGGEGTQGYNAQGTVNRTGTTLSFGISSESTITDMHLCISYANTTIMNSNYIVSLIVDYENISGSETWRIKCMYNDGSHVSPASVSGTMSTGTSSLIFTASGSLRFMPNDGSYAYTAIGYFTAVSNEDE